MDPASGILYAGQGAGVPNLHTVDPNTGTATLVGNTQLGGGAVPGLAFDRTGRLYAAMNLVDDGGTGGDSLAILDTSTGLGVVVGPFGGGIGSSGGPGGIDGIAFNSSGRLYGTSAKQASSAPTAVPTLYTIDPVTGTATAVGPLVNGSGVPLAGGVVGLDFDADGKLYGGTGQQTGSLVRINPATGVVTFIGPSVSRSLATLSFLACGCFGVAECDDGNSCTSDSCDLVSGACLNVSPPGEMCDDGNARTADTCDPVLGCAHQPVSIGEPMPLQFGSQTTMSWPATPDATHWNTYRGTVPETMLGSRPPGTVYDHACYESGDALGDGPMTATDSGDQPAGTAYYYLDSGEGACGESTVGNASSGDPIPNASACPTPP